MNTTHDVVAMLKTGKFVVTFQKKDGEIRHITGSLPRDATAINEHSVPIIEADTGAWKSFRLDSLIVIMPAV
jgi:hypothetical protein